MKPKAPADKLVATRDPRSPGQRGQRMAAKRTAQNRADRHANVLATVNLATVVQRGMEIREESWDAHHPTFYTVDLKTACQMAADERNAPELAIPAYLMLCGAWNEALEWAKGVIEGPMFFAK